MALAYLGRIWSKGVLGIMVLISVIGVMLGVASLVVTLSVMNGFHTEITRKLLSLNPHILIIDSLGTAEFDTEVLSAVGKISSVKSYSGFIYAKAIIQRRKNNQGVVVKGMDPATSRLELTQGKWGDLAEGSIVIGEELAGELYLDIGDEVYMIIPNVEKLGMPVIPKIEKFRVSGMFSSGIYEYDSGLVFIDNKQAAVLFSSDFSSRGMELYLDDPFKAGKITGEIRESLKGLYSVSSWEDRNSNLFAALKLEKFMMFIVLVMIVIVATFNIAGSLIMISVTRSRDTGILRAIGATKNQIRMMFSLKGIVIGLAGSVAGTIAGLIICFIISRYEIIKLPPRVYLISTLPVRPDFHDILVITLVAVIISFIATIYPSVRAGDTDVADMLRYE